MFVAHTKRNHKITEKIQDNVNAMATDVKNLIHGRETYVVYYGNDFILKRPLPTLNDDKRAAWLAKQQKTKAAIDAIRAIENPVYNVPAMVYIHDGEYQILEERAHGEPLTAKLYASLTKPQQFKIINSMASFLVDMNELKPIGDIQKYKIANDIKFARLDKFIENKMSLWFTKSEVSTMANIRDHIGTFEYETRLAWSHGDLNSGNVLYDAQNSKISFIDFAEADYKFIYRDIFAPLQIELDIYKRVYETYYQLHNKDLFPMLGPKNDALREIMKYRVMATCLRRFIKASDDLRIKPMNSDSANNNLAKISFMRQQIQTIVDLEHQFSK